MFSSFHHIDVNQQLFCASRRSALAKIRRLCVLMVLIDKWSSSAISLRLVSAYVQVKNVPFRLGQGFDVLEELLEHGRGFIRGRGDGEAAFFQLFVLLGRGIHQVVDFEVGEFSPGPA